MNAVLEARGVAKAYAGDGVAVQAVRDVDLVVERGEFVAIMGPSGCGKSTLLHLLGGLARPSAGMVLVDGEDLSSLSDRELADLRGRRLGFIFQAFNLVPVLSVEENLALPAIIAGRPAAESREKVERLLEATGLAGKATKRPSQLSGGEQQRVAIARALVMEPEVILADEPTGNLDTATGRRVVELLLDLHREGQTIVLVTHDVKIAGVASRLFLMRDGRLLAHEPVERPDDAAELIDRLLDQS